MQGWLAIKMKHTLASMVYMRTVPAPVKAPVPAPQQNTIWKSGVSDARSLSNE